MGSLIGSRGTKSSSETEGSGTSSGFTNATSSGKATSSAVSSSSSDPGFMKELQTVLDRQLNGTTGFTKQDAINDVQGLLRTQATDALQSVMPTIAKADRQAGAYNSTTRELLQNDANSRITAQLANTVNDAIGNYAKIEQGNIGAFSGATQAGTTQGSNSVSSSDNTQSSSSVSQNQSEYSNESWNHAKGGGSGIIGALGMEDGGQVPNQGFTDFVAQMGNQLQQMTSQPMTMAGAQKAGQAGGELEGMAAAAETDMGDSIIDMALSWFGFEQGGKVPEGKKATPDQELLQAIQKYKNGGKVRSASDDAAAGGKIKGPESSTGEDNQIIKVAGGEGILAKDVMQVPGVPELVKFLNAQYHKPIQ